MNSENANHIEWSEAESIKKYIVCLNINSEA